MSHPDPCYVNYNTNPQTRLSEEWNAENVVSTQTSSGHFTVCTPQQLGRSIPRILLSEKPIYLIMNYKVDCTFQIQMEIG